MEPIPEPPPPKQHKLSPLYQIVLSKQSKPPTPDSLLYTNKLRSREQPILGKTQKTNPIIWCGAIICMVFSLLLIFFAVTIIIIYLVVKPKTPVFDTPAASLSIINFSSPQLLSSDLTFLANFSNPNWKLNVRFEYLLFEFYFMESLITSQVVEPFNQKPGEVRAILIRLVPNLVYLPQNLALELQKQEIRNRVIYNIKGTFKVRVKFGSVHYSYSLHGNCEMEMTSPPNGVLIAHSCRTKR